MNFSSNSTSSSSDRTTNREESIAKILDFFSFLSKKYFRSEMIFKDQNEIRSTTARLFVSNHSGMSFPWDTFILHESLARHFDGILQIKRMSAPILFSSRLMRPYGVDEYWNYFCVPASTASFESLIESGKSVMIHPEGLAGIAKGFDKRYQLQAFATSSVRMSLKYGIPIIPISIVNAEYLNPFTYNSYIANRVMKFLGFPFFPVGITTPLLLIFPAFFYSAMPAKLRFVIGEKIDVRSLTTQSPNSVSEMEIRRLTTILQTMMQRQLEKSVAEHGREIYNFSELRKSILSLGWRGIALHPFFWPFMFHKAAAGNAFDWSAKIRAYVVSIILMIPVLGWPLYFAYLFLARDPIEK